MNCHIQRKTYLFGKLVPKEVLIPGKQRMDKLKPQWEPGQSGNPNGRPKSSVTTLLKEKDTHKIAQKLYEMALEGDLGAIKEYLDRTEGKVSQDLNVKALVAEVTPEMLAFFKNRLLGAKARSKGLIKEHKEPSVLNNEDKQPSISENKA